MPPHVSASVQWQGDRWVAVCSAERGKPAASIVWKNLDDTFVPREETQSHPDGLYTVKSQLDLPEGVATDNLTCTVQHPFWDTEQIYKPQASTGTVGYSLNENTNIDETRSGTVFFFLFHMVW